MSVNMSHHIVFLDHEGIAPSVRLAALPFAHFWQSHGYTTADCVVERLQHATIALTCSVPLRAEHLRQLPKLQMISLALTGTDIVDMDYCRSNGIVVTNVPGYATNAVAEHVIAMMFALLRRNFGYHRVMQKVYLGERKPKNIYFDFRIRDAALKTMGIIGNGAIAQRLARLAQGLGMQTRFYDRGGSLHGDSYMPLAQLLACSDVLSINVPLTQETHHMIGARELAQMKPDAILINTARGGVVDEAALIAALQGGVIGGAALDVLAHEPIRPDDPIMQLLERDDFILTPHVAWSSEEAMQGLIDRALDNIVRFVGAKTSFGPAGQGVA